MNNENLANKLLATKLKREMLTIQNKLCFQYLTNNEIQQLSHELITLQEVYSTICGKIFI